MQTQRKFFSYSLPIYTDFSSKLESLTFFESHNFSQERRGENQTKWHPSSFPSSPEEDVQPVPAKPVWASVHQDPLAAPETSPASLKASLETDPKKTKTMMSQSGSASSLETQTLKPPNLTMPASMAASPRRFGSPEPSHTQTILRSCSSIPRKRIASPRSSQCT